MKRRCGSPSATSYANYGGRGISVCERWQNSFENFRADMGPKPSSSHTLDRINNDGNYEPGNCRWATTAEQSLNKRPDRRTTPASVVHKIVALRGHFTGVDIAKALNVSRSTVKKAWKRAAK